MQHHFCFNGVDQTIRGHTTSNTTSPAACDFKLPSLIISTDNSRWEERPCTLTHCPAKRGYQPDSDVAVEQARVADALREAVAEHLDSLNVHFGGEEKQQTAAAAAAAAEV